MVYTPQGPGKYRVNVKILGHRIKGSPYSVYLRALGDRDKLVDALKCKAYGRGLHGRQAVLNLSQLKEGIKGKVGRCLRDSM